MGVDQKCACLALRFGKFKLRSSAYKHNLKSAVNGYSPGFFTPLPAPHSPHVSTTVCPIIYASAIAAIGQVISTAPVAAAAPTTAVTASLWLATLSMIPLIKASLTFKPKDERELIELRQSTQNVMQATV